MRRDSTSPLGYFLNVGLARKRMFFQDGLKDMLEPGM